MKGREKREDEGTEYNLSMWCARREKSQGSSSFIQFIYTANATIKPFALFCPYHQLSQDKVVTNC